MIKFLKVRDVKDPIRDVNENAGIDFFIPEKSDSLIAAIVAFNPNITFSDNTIIIPPHEDVKIPAGIKSVFDKNIAFIAANKSGVATKNKLIFGAQVIDSSYQGEWNIHLINWSKQEQRIEFGKKIIQFIPTIISNEEHTVEDLLFTTEEEFFPEKTNRGAGGFGSTGV